MMTRHAAIAAIFFTFATISAPQLFAWSLFGGKDKSKIEQSSDEANKAMLRADGAFDDGNYGEAAEFYATALDGFKTVESIDPRYMDGVARIRITYCASQLTNAVAAMHGVPTTLPVASSAEKDLAADRVPSEYGADNWIKVLDNSAGSATNSSDKANEKMTPEEFALTLKDAAAMLHDNNFSDVLPVLATLLREDPTNRSVRLMLALLRMHQGRHDEAIAALEDLRGRRSDLPILLTISGAYVGCGRYIDALSALNDAARIAPDDPAVSMNLAWLTLLMPDETGKSAANATLYYRKAIRDGAERDRELERRINLKTW